MINEQTFREKGIGIYLPYVYEEYGKKLLHKIGLISKETRKIPEIERTALNSPRYETLYRNSEVLQNYYDSIKLEYEQNYVSISSVVGLDSFYELLLPIIEEKGLVVEYREPENNLELFDDICFSLISQSLIHRKKED